MVVGLQGVVLKLFKIFGYDCIGLNCCLQGVVCYMSGLELIVDGYIIVDGSGLLYFEVIGYQVEVDWFMLICWLKVVIEGNVLQVC